MGARNKLTDTKIRAAIRESISIAKVKKVQDGGNLSVTARPSGIASFIYKYSRGSKRHELGLGAYPLVSLARAREGRDQWERCLKLQGLDPIQERARQKRDASVSDNTLSVVAVKAYEAKKAGMKNDNPKWLSAVNKHVLPKIGDILVADLNQNDIHQVLQPLWNTQYPTASVALKRLSLIIKHAAAMGEDVDVNITTKAKALLGETTHKLKHHGAVRWENIPNLYQSIPETHLKYLALKFSILVPSVRSSPIRHLRLNEIVDGTWTVPADNLKSKKGKAEDYKIILSDEASRIIELARPYTKNNWVFPNSNGGPLDDKIVRRTLEEFVDDAKPHGLRSSLSTWLEEAVTVPTNVKKSLLAHSVGNTVEKSYNRSNYVEARKVWLDRWEAHCLGHTGNVLQLAGAESNG